MAGADPGGGVDGWLAIPLECAMSIILFVWTLSDLLEQTILVTKVYDEMQINHLDKTLHDGGRTLTAARACGLTQSN